MLWMLPLLAALFWFITYRPSMALRRCGTSAPWPCRRTAVSVFVPTVVGAAAWLGSRERRHGMADLVTGTARPRWARQLATWAATTVLGDGGLPGLRGCPLRRDRAAGRLGRAVVVAGRGRRREPAGVAALGFAAGALRPSRFTAPLVAIGVFLALRDQPAVHPRRPTRTGRSRRWSPAPGRLGH